MNTVNGSSFVFKNGNGDFPTRLVPPTIVFNFRFWARLSSFYKEIISHVL
jgi:hypothetical protein